MEVAFRVVDVFTRTPFQGNPAAVVLDARGLTEVQMQRIAAEMNLSETAFVLPADASEGAHLRLRWFTPACEVNMCGHATIGAVHALHEAGLLPATSPGEPLAVATRGGRLEAHVEPEPTGPPIIWLDLRPPVLKPEPFASGTWSRLLGVPAETLAAEPAPVRTQDGDLILFVRDVLTLNGLRPEREKLAAYSRERRIRGVCVATTATLNPIITVQSRFFAPALGIDEDPVTGSVHGPLAAHLVASGVAKTIGDMAALTCTQATPAGRAGLVRVLVQRRPDARYEVRIGGQCVTVSAGTLQAGES